MKKILSGLCVIVLMLLSISPVNAQDIDVSLHSRYGYLFDRTTKMVYLDQESHEQIYPASMTKVLTVSLALEKIENIHQKVRVSSQDLEGLYEAGATTAGFYAGEQVTYEDLLYGALLPSGADACQALARLTYGSDELMVQAMNEWVAELGLKQSHFMNVTGLHDDQHYTSVYDMAMILDQALKNDDFVKVFNARTYVSSSSRHTWASTLQRAHNAYDLDISQLDGAKSGFTDAAQLTLASTMTFENHQFILVTAYAQGQYTQNHVRDAIAVCQELHQHYHEVIVYKKDEDVQDYWILQSFQPRYTYHFDRDISLIVSSDQEKADLDIQLKTSSWLIAPMSKGENIGTLTIKDDLGLVYTCDMLLNSDITSSMMERMCYYGIIVLMIGALTFVVIVIRKKKKDNLQ